MGKTAKTVQVRSWTEDVIESQNQNCTLPASYRWIREEWYFRLWAWISYRLVRGFGRLYCRWFLHLKFRNLECLHSFEKGGIFLYGNHTQPVGDVVIPALAVKPRRIYSIGSPANLGIPVIGKLLPAVGILPTPSDFHQTKEFYTAVQQRAQEGNCVVTFPEAHVWPFYTGIRPFPDSSFRFPVECGCPAFAMTTTYQKRRFGKKPGITVYLDGPFFPEPGLSPKEARKNLRDKIREAMITRSALSNVQYIRYEMKAEGQSVPKNEGENP